MTILQPALLFFVALFAGTINSVAGGGSLFAVPTMIFSGILPVLATTTSTVVFWFGSAISIVPYRHGLSQIHIKLKVLFVTTGLIGGSLGAILLLHTS